MIISDYHAEFVAAFGRSDVDAAHLHSLRKRKGWKVGREPGRTKGRLLKYSAAEIAWLRENCGLMIGEFHSAFCVQFGRVDISAEQLNALRKRQGWKTGRTGHFAKGAAPANKGKKMPFNAKSAATQFKKGQVPHTFRGAGHESVDEDGYVWIIIDAPNPWTGAATRRIHKHRCLWEQANGPVPEGYVLKCLDSDKLNTDPSNWEAIPMAVLPRLNGRFGRGYDTAPAELKPTIMAVAKLEHASRTRREAAR
ncbi:HNH endonuclease [Devosia sp. Root635]|uniref:HNH endonuclease n=1 Tax=Devosia sp. Root635 TaxID=1736575 RepID=UPI0009E9EEA6|nr:HNH endonuclease [Devosia sp. Root635]